jgi:nitroreductase
MFSMSLIYALHAAGVESCPLNLSMYCFHDIKLHRLLDIPNHETPIMMMAIGYPPDELEVACSSRLPIEHFINYRNR